MLLFSLFQKLGGRPLRTPLLWQEAAARRHFSSSVERIVCSPPYPYRGRIVDLQVVEEQPTKRANTKRVVDIMHFFPSHRRLVLSVSRQCIIK